MTFLHTDSSIGYQKQLFNTAMIGLRIMNLLSTVNETQIEAVIGTTKSAKKLKNQTLLLETLRKGKTDNLKKMTSFFGKPVEVTEHQSLNS